MIQQLTTKEIGDIISFLRDDCPDELIKRLKDLALETEFYIQFQNKLIVSKMDQEKEIMQNGFGTSPVRNAYWEIKQETQE